MIIVDNNAAIEHVSREKASSDPGSVGSPMVSVVLQYLQLLPSLLTGKLKHMKDLEGEGDHANIQSGVVIDVRVKEGQEVKAGDPLCVLSAMKVGVVSVLPHHTSAPDCL